MLVGYVVPSPGQVPSEGVLRDYLRARLPEYLVPTAIVVLDRLPLTANGKIDREALPEPTLATPGEQGPADAPRDAIELHLLKIWESVLATEPIGVNDDFFALGGHSLSATRVVSRVSDVLGVEVLLRSLFEHPTVRGLATVIAEKLSTTQASGSSPDAGQETTSIRTAAPPIPRINRDEI
jgi:acyl carrier protein